MIINKKDRNLKKGGGFHLDLLIVGVAAAYLGLLGLPFLVSATVRSISHCSALTIYSRTNAPGEKPHMEGVHEQRVTGIAVHILIGTVESPNEDLP